MSIITYQGGLSIEEVKARVKVDKIYKMSSNENPLGSSPKALAAIEAALTSLYCYPPRRDDELYKALAAFHGRGLTADYFVSGSGGVEVLEFVTRALLTADDEAIICPPTFGWYVRSIERTGGKCVMLPLDAQTFAHPIDGILAAVNERTRLVYVCNPHNPTGSLLTATEMARLVRALPAYVTLVADEVYQHFVQRDDFPDSLAYVLSGRNVIIIQSFSKAYGLAGSRLGYAIATPSLIARLRQWKRPFHTNHLTLVAGMAALKDTAHLQRTVELVRRGKQYLYDAFTQLGVCYWPSETNFVLIKPPIDAQVVHDQLIERGIMVRPTKNNGLPGYLRVTVGVAEANKAFIAALADILTVEQVI